MSRIIMKSCFGLLALLSLCGCASYRARPLVQFTRITSTDQEGISFSYKVFDKIDCKKYLDRDVLSKGYQPIHISIANNTKRRLSFSAKNINLPTVDALEVAQAVHTSTVKRAVGYGVLGILLWPFFIPAVVDGIGSSRANQELDTDFMNKVLREETIQPFGTLNGLIFVPSESFCEEFEIRLVDQETGSPVVLQSKNQFIQAV